MLATWGGAEASARLQALDGDAPYRSVSAYVGDMAALCATYWLAVCKRPHKGGSPMYESLWRACAPERLDYARNNQRRLVSLAEGKRAQMASGTTEVEALNREINNHFRFYGHMYQATLRLTIDAFSFLKLLTHNSAEYCPTLVQTNQRTVSVHMTSAFALSDAEWKSVAGSETPLMLLRTEHKSSIRASMHTADVPKRKRRGFALPGVRKKPAGVVERHTFNKKRLAS